MKVIKYLGYALASPLRKKFILADNIAIQSKEDACAALEAAKLRRAIKAEKRLANERKRTSK